MKNFDIIKDIDGLRTIYRYCATAEDFQKLPNVTQEQAEAIVRLRTQIQYFQNIYELLYADGMTDRLFLSIRDYLYVSFA